MRPLVLTGVVVWLSLAGSWATAESALSESANAHRLTAAAIIEARATADLIEQQARIVKGLQDCQKMGVSSCGPGATLSRLSPPSLLGLPSKPDISEPVVEPVVDLLPSPSETITPTSALHYSSLSPPPLAAVPLSLPKVLGLANGRVQLELNGRVFSVKSGDALPNGLTVSRLSPQSVLLTNTTTGQHYPLSLRWGSTPASAPTNNAPSLSAPVPFPIPGIFQ